MSIPSWKVTVSLFPSVFLGVYNDDLRKLPPCAPLTRVLSSTDIGRAEATIPLRGAGKENGEGRSVEIKDGV